MNVRDAVELLLVEDNSADLELTVRALKKQNVTSRVFVVRDGVEALDFLFATGAYAARAGQKPAKVIFLDLKLPKLSGAEVLRRMKSDHRTQAIPVVVLTSSQQEKDMSECYRLGANSYIVKPVDFTQFTQTIAETGRYWLTLNQTPS